MPVKIRLMRIGAKKRPFYRVVAVDERRKRTGGYLDLLGTYNPLTEPKEIILNQEKIDGWKKKGAVMSNGFLRIIGQAPQRSPRKPKKEQKEEAPATPAPTEGGEGVAADESHDSDDVVEEADSSTDKAASVEQPIESAQTTAEETDPEVQVEESASEKVGTE